MEKGNRLKKNLCLAQYAHAIQFKKRIVVEPRVELTGKKIIAKNLQDTTKNKENEGFQSANQTQRFTPSQQKSSRSPSLTRNKSLNELLENLNFKNRNLKQIIRIRQEQFSISLTQQKTELLNQFSLVQSEIDALELKKTDLTRKQNELLYEGTSKLINENRLLSENIAYLKDSISQTKSSSIDAQTHFPSKQRIHNLEQLESLSFKTSQELKLKLKILSISNELSHPVQTYLKQRQNLLEILNSISTLKLIILRVIDKVPIIPSKLEEIDKGVVGENSLVEIVSKILEKSRSLRKLVSDKFAENFTEGCKTM